MYPGDPPISWRVFLKRNGQPLDITDSTISAPVTDDGVLVAHLEVEKTDPEGGEITLTITDTIYAAVKLFSSWRLREEPYFGTSVVRGRLVKAI
jgi:hypothetical protein